MTHRTPVTRLDLSMDWGRNIDRAWMLTSKLAQTKTSEHAIIARAVVRVSNNERI